VFPPPGRTTMTVTTAGWPSSARVTLRWASAGGLLISC